MRAWGSGRGCGGGLTTCLPVMGLGPCPLNSLNATLIPYHQPREPLPPGSLPHPSLHHARLSPPHAPLGALTPPSAPLALYPSHPHNRLTTPLAPTSNPLGAPWHSTYSTLGCARHSPPPLTRDPCPSTPQLPPSSMPHVAPPDLPFPPPGRASPQPTSNLGVLPRPHPTLPYPCPNTPSLPPPPPAWVRCPAPTLPCLTPWLNPSGPTPPYPQMPNDPTPLHLGAPWPNPPPPRRALPNLPQPQHSGSPRPRLTKSLAAQVALPGRVPPWLTALVPSRW